MQSFLKTVRIVCKFCQQLALECKKLMKMGIFLELDSLHSYPVHLWYNLRPVYLFMPGFQAFLSFVDLHYWHLLIKCVLNNRVAFINRYEPMRGGLEVSFESGII